MADRTFVGGLSIEVAYFGLRRFNASIPFAMLQVSDEGLWLGARRSVSFPRRRTFVKVKQSDVATVFRARRWAFGVGIETVDGKTHYLLNGGRSAVVLKELAYRGYTVSAERRASYGDLLGIPFLWKAAQAVRRMTRRHPDDGG